MNTVILIVVVLVVVVLYGAAKKKQGASERDTENWMEYDDRLYDILNQEEKIRLMRHLEKMEPADAVDLLRRGGLRREDGKPGYDSPMRPDAGTSGNGKPKAD